MNYTEYLQHVSKAASYPTVEAFTAQTDCHADIKAHEIVYAVSHNDFDSLMRLSGLKMKRFAEKFNISYNTVQKWRYNTVNRPAYLIQLLGYAMISELREAK